MNNAGRQLSLSILFVCSFLLWLFSFRGFLAGHIPLTSDAVSYYEHTRFYIDHLSRGVYPLWDPLCGAGCPNEFFLRRIGPFNPLIFLIIALNKLGFPYITAYLSALCLYYFTGLIGFYKLALGIFRDERCAFTAFLLLLFSSLGTRIFDSYLILLAVPLIWFFYFLARFAVQPQRHHVMGMAFCVMITATTYIPFYFLTIVLTFVLCYAAVYGKELKGILARGAEFCKKNTGFTAVCVTAVMLSLVPGFLFFKEGGRAEFVLPLRHFDSKITHVLGVDHAVITQWAILEDLFFSSFFVKNLRDFGPAVFYIPLLAYIVFLLGFFTKITRRLFFFFLWGMLIFFMGSPYTVPLYDFLYAHVFYFKYFRNLHFFLWLVLLPVFILFIVEQLRMLLAAVPQDRAQEQKFLGWVVMAHLGLAVFLWGQGSSSLSTWLTLGLSLVCCFFYVKKKGKIQDAVLSGCVLALIVPQSLEAFHFFSRNVFKKSAEEGWVFRNNVFHFPGDRSVKDSPLTAYDRWAFEFPFVQPGSPAPQNNQEAPAKSYFYLGTQWFGVLHENLGGHILDEYLRHKLTVYDQVKVMDDKAATSDSLGRLFAGNVNLAIVSSDDEPRHAATPASSPAAQRITGDSFQLKVLAFDANSLRLRTNFDARKFLVYNDSFYRGWKVFINGKQEKIHRANVAFKGVWVPAGERIVDFRYGETWRYGVEWALLAVFGIFFCFFLRQWYCDSQV